MQLKSVIGSLEKKAKLVENCGYQWGFFMFFNAVKPVLSGHSKEDKKYVFKTNNRLMQVKSIVEFCSTFDLH